MAGPGGGSGSRPAAGATVPLRSGSEMMGAAAAYLPRSPCLPASPLGSYRLLHLWGSRGTRVLGLDLSGPSCSLGLVQEPPGQVATPETHVSDLEAPPRSQEGPKGQLLMALVAIPGLGVFGEPTRREDRSTRDGAERGHQPLPVCLQDFRLLELVLKAGAGC